MAEKVPSVKLHRRRVELDGRAFTVLTLRPSTKHRYATNYFHGTWHVLTDAGGAQLLGRLCWSHAFQRQPGTIMVIDHPFLVPNPSSAGGPIASTVSSCWQHLRRPYSGGRSG